MEAHVSQILHWQQAQTVVLNNILHLTEPSQPRNIVTLSYSISLPEVGIPCESLVVLQMRQLSRRIMAKPPATVKVLEIPIT